MNKEQQYMFDKKYDLKGKEFIKPISPTYSIPIYENGIKTEWSVDGVIGDEKYPTSRRTIDKNVGNYLSV